MSLFELSRLRVRFPTGRSSEPLTVVEDFSFSVEEGKTLAVVGESGSGKTVSLLAATGLLDGAEISGEVRFRGKNLLSLGQSESRKILGEGIGFVFQDPGSNLHPFRRIGAQIGEAIRAHHRVGGAELRSRIAEMLGEVGLGGDPRIPRAYPAELSGGQRQRVMIAIAVANRPSLIIADEPTTALDAGVQAGVLRLFRQLQQRHGTALVFVSHDLAVTESIADDIVVVRHGHVVERGSRERIYRAPEEPYTRELLAASALHAFSTHPRRTAAFPPEGATPVLEVDSLAKSYRVGQRRRTVIQDVGFSIRPGEILALVGESGSGKSTIGRIVAGLQYADTGTVRLDGNVFPTAAADGIPPLANTIRSLVQLVFQDPYTSLNPRRTVAQTIASAAALRPDAGREATAARVAEVAERTRIDPELLSRHPRVLSGGQRQRVAIARALFPSPRLLVADEALSALDVTTQREIILLLQELQRDGLAILLITHDLGVVSSVADSAVVLGPDGVEEQGDVADILAMPRSVYARRLLDAVPRLGAGAGA